MRRIILVVLSMLLWPAYANAATLTYWNVFNIEGESAVSAAFVTYSTLEDMLRDQNRTGLFEPAAPFGRNIVGSGSDGTSYWNVFNIEGESAISAAFVTYGTLDDMLRDQNRTGLFAPAAPFGRNIVGSGASIIEDVPAPVPVPASLPLFLGALLLLKGVRMRRPLPLSVCLRAKLSLDRQRWISPGQQA